MRAIRYDLLKIQEAIAELLDPATLEMMKHMFGSVLALGNYMNAGHKSLAKAHGYKLDVMVKRT